MLREIFFFGYGLINTAWEREKLCMLYFGPWFKHACPVYFNMIKESNNFDG